MIIAEIGHSKFVLKDIDDANKLLNIFSQSVCVDRDNISKLGSQYVLGAHYDLSINIVNGHPITKERFKELEKEYEEKTDRKN